LVGNTPPDHPLRAATEYDNVSSVHENWKMSLLAVFETFIKV